MGDLRTALVSVYDKTGIGDFARALNGAGIEIIASGGTGAHLKTAGIDCEDISRTTGKATLLGGLVKTLHPAIHAGILADRANPAHMEELAALGYRKIDLVVVNFYALPDQPRGEDLSFIDIGGPAMARAAAKNFGSCVPVSDPSWYGPVATELAANGQVAGDLRWRLARDTLARTAAYDARVLQLVGSDESALRLGLAKCLDLRYGENPHQRAGFYTSDGECPFAVLKGSLSYNNILDLDCCMGQLAEFDSRAAVVVKHVGPCGVAQSESSVGALEGAYNCDPVSAYGGVIGVNFCFDAECAAFLAKRFVECIVAPAFDEAALAMLAKKKSRLVVAEAGVPTADALGGLVLRSAAGGVLAQTRDSLLVADGLKFASGAEPTPAILGDLIFAWKVAKHAKSNAIVFARDGRTLGIGSGQPSRVDSTRIAIVKAVQAGHDIRGSVMASDGFFPFADSVELAAVAGAVAVIQPGGSIRDEEVIAAAKKLGITMALTSIRHFKH
ncbi:MAG TPA: bifunctional phosphoribosylaminoimidazolecarboxamide formyltransferase/IMP cyclohydrolase [bacterium]|nr:bifunctional phosphoribosylaminoimidazolecarboxamide formyltransferase/IMP cyclohydrolase [bacterium]